MIVYRITLEKWAKSLIASGRAARWNSNGHFMVYTASSRALACLENVVHRHSFGKDDLFKVMVIVIPDDLAIAEIKKGELPKNWSEYTNYASCQALGDSWLNNNDTPVLRIPSSIIPQEFNYLINPQHPDFRKIAIHGIENFSFDERLVKKNVN
jgi:RES domain-containing protein